MESEHGTVSGKGPSSIVVAEKDEELRLKIAARLFREGFEVAQAWDSVSLSAAMARGGASLVLLDLELPEPDALRILPELRARYSSIPVIILANGSPPEMVARAIEFGALEAVRKPVDLQALAIRVLALLGPPANPPRSNLPAAVWSSATRHVYEALERAAGRDSTVLLTGETGTGKEIGARTLHGLSRRRNKPFVCVNCAALSSGLLESELFGHERGAFTGADRTRKGRFELADGGSILLDEIGELDRDLQAKLLRVLQERSFERVGSSEPIQVDVRVIATTNRDLEEAVTSGTFREDLYYRLDVLPIRMPPLRERPSEIPLLLEHFLKKQGARTEVCPKVLERLLGYHWPGNVRELESLVELLVGMGKLTRIELNDLPEKMIQEVDVEECDSSLKSVLRGAERRHLKVILGRVGWKQRRAADLLRISRTTLQKKLEEYGIEPPRGVRSEA